MEGTRGTYLPRLREIRQRRALTLEDLAQRSGISIATLSKLENQKQGAYPKTIRTLATTLRVGVEALMGLEPLPEPPPPFDEVPAIGKVA